MMNKNISNAAIIGSNNKSESLIRFSEFNQKEIPVLLLKYEEGIESLKNLLYFKEWSVFKKTIINNQYKSIFYCFDNFDEEKLIFLSKFCEKQNINLYVLSNKFSVENKLFLDLRKIHFIFNNGFSIKYLIITRITDVVLSLFFLLCSLPITIISAIFILIEDGLPLFFLQERVGKDGKIFTMYKFRSMYNPVKKYAKSPSVNDDKRITKIGKIIREKKIDEIPQFINVLKGEMSIVGPRPEMKFIVDEYNEFELLRLKQIPGVTGEWQLSNCRNYPIHHNVDFDLNYLIKRSIINDMKIILKTLFFTFKR